MTVTRQEQIIELFKIPRQCNVQYLYKYRSMESHELIEGLDAIFKDNSIYLSDPTSFNDPFECRPVLTIHRSQLKNYLYIRDMIRKQHPSKSKKEQDKLIKKAKLMIQDKTYQEHVYTEFIKTIGVYSLSQINNDILMWSHYSNKHKGLCIEFDASQEVILFGQALKVNYSEKYPIVNTFDIGNPKEFRKALLTKSNHWSYEQEWRILKLKNDGGFRKYYFPPELLTGIIMGALISPEYRDIILRWVSNYPTKITLYQAKINRTRYQLDIEPI